MKKVIALLLMLTMLCTLGTVAVTASSATTASFTVSGAFGDNMILQRGDTASIWGWSDKKGSKITVKFKGKTTEGTVDNAGAWLIKFPVGEADKNFNDLTVSMGSDSVTFAQVRVGDIWLVGGQSNAELTISQVSAYYKTSAVKSMFNGLVSYFQQGREDVKNNQELMATPQADVVSGGKWKAETSSNVGEFSAMGFFFANALSTKLDVPIGMVMVASAGSPLSQLMSTSAVAITNYTRFENNIPVSGMYNALMNPFINMKFKGMIFYQGESEAGLAQTDYGKYNVYLKAYVEDLRTKTSNNFPFYYVQLSSHTLDNWAGVGEQRAVQFDSAALISNSSMVVSMDYGYRTGDADWAHPYYKKPVGERLCALALTKTYNIGDANYVLSPSPLYAYNTADGIVIKYQYVGDGLKKVGSAASLLGFKAILAGGYQNVTAKILDKDKVLLSTASLSGVKGVGYGLELLSFVEYDNPTYVSNLGNSTDLPSPAFKLTKVYDSEEQAIQAISGVTPAASSKNTAGTTPGTNATATTATSVTASAAASGKQPVIWLSVLFIGAIVAGAVVLIAAGVIITLVIIRKKKRNAIKDETKDAPKE